MKTEVETKVTHHLTFEDVKEAIVKAINTRSGSELKMEDFDITFQSEELVPIKEIKVIAKTEHSHTRSD